MGYGSTPFAGLEAELNRLAAQQGRNPRGLDRRAIHVLAGALMGRTVRKKRTEVTIETRRILAISPRAWCEQCSHYVERVTPEQAAAIIGVDRRAIDLRLKAGRLHFIEAGGAVWICLESLWV